MGKVNSTLFIRRVKGGGIFLCKIYVEDIIFGGNSQVHQFSKLMSKFEITMMGELKFFLDLQVKQLCDGTFISQEKYTLDT
jgi:hypothetical protein